MGNVVIRPPCQAIEQPETDRRAEDALATSPMDRQSVPIDPGMLTVPIDVIARGHDDAGFHGILDLLSGVPQQSCDIHQYKRCVLSRLDSHGASPLGFSGDDGMRQCITEAQCCWGPLEPEMLHLRLDVKPRQSARRPADDRPAFQYDWPTCGRHVPRVRGHQRPRAWCRAGRRHEAERMRLPTDDVADTDSVTAPIKTLLRFRPPHPPKRETLRLPPFLPASRSRNADSEVSRF